MSPPLPNDGAAAPRARRLVRRLLVAAGVIALLPPVALVAAASLYFRHQPYAVPEAWAPPPLPAEGAPGLVVRYLGVSGYAISDGETTLLLDPTPTRPTVRRLLLGPLKPDPRHLGEFPEADFILVNHTHFDHALDVPAIALSTGATVVGCASTVNLARSRGVPAERTILAQDGERLVLGTFEVDVRATRHTDIAGRSEPMSGTIPEDAGRLWFWQYTYDTQLAYRLTSGKTSIWFHPSSVYQPGTAEGLPAGTLILGVTGEPLTDEKIRAALSEVRPARILPTHYDNFLQPIGRGLALMPGLDLEEAYTRLRAADPDVAFHVLDYGDALHLPLDADRF